MADDAAFGSFEEKWLQANPEQAIVAVFLPLRQRRPGSAFGCLINEIEETIFAIREPQVAAAKLNWWRDGLARAAAGHARHPVTHELFTVAGAARDLQWSSLVDGALRLLDPATPSSIADAFSTLGIFYGVVAKLEAELLDANIAAGDADADLWSSARLLSLAARVDRQPERSPLPLDLLARHGLTRAGLVEPCAARSAAFRDFLDAWCRKTQAALDAQTGSTARRVRARLDLGLCRNAMRAHDPVVALASSSRGRWRSVFVAWSEAGRARRNQLKGGGA